MWKLFSFASFILMVKEILSAICFALFVSPISAQQKNTSGTNGSIPIEKYFEIEADYPSGNIGWKRYLDSSLSKINFASFFTNPKQDSCISFKISFTVSTTGQLINIENKSREAPPPLLLTEIKKIFAGSPKWRSAVYKGIPVNSYRQQSFSIIIAHNED